MIKPEAPASAALAVVVVNHDQAQVEVLSKPLAAEGIPVRAFESAADALVDLSPGEPPGLIITGLCMPGIDGLRFCRLLRSPDYAPLNRVPIVVVSDILNREAAASITADLGATAFLPLPVDGPELGKLARRLIRGELLPQPHRVLVVEDDPLQAAALKDEFEARGFPADLALTGREAQAKFSQVEYDTVIIDHHLPDLGGKKLLAGFLQQRPGTVYLAITGDPDPKLALEWMKLGAAAFISKPFLPYYAVELCQKARRERELLRVESRLECRTRELRQSEERLREVLENSLDASYKRDLHTGVYEYLSPVFGQLTGHTPEEMKALPIASVLALIHPDDVPEVQRVLSATLADPASASCQLEYRFQDKKGTYRWLQDRFTVLRDAQGRPSALIGSVGDLTERKAAEALLSQERHLVQTIFETTPGFLVLKDEEGVYQEANPAFCRFLGKRREEIVGKTDYGLFPREEAAAYRAGDAEIMRLGRWDHFEERVSGAEGKRWLQVTRAPVKNDAGQCTGVLCSGADFTLRKRAEEALRESEANFHAFFDTVGDMVVVAGLDGRILFTNQALQKRLGYSVGELAGLRVADLHPADQRRDAESLFSAVLRGERPDCPLPLAAKDGTLVFVESRAWRGRWNGADCLFGLSKDLSAEREARQRFESLFRRNPALMAVSTVPEQRFCEVNDAFLATLGYERGEVIGHTVAELSLFPNPPEQLAVAERVQREGRFEHIELQVRRKDGQILAGLFSGEVVSNQGRPYFLTVMVDLTGRKQAEAALERSERNYREIFDATSEAIALHEIGSGRFVEVNDALVRLFGYDTKEDILARNIGDLSVNEPPYTRAEGEHKTRLAVKQGPQVFEWLARKKNGDCFWVEISLRMSRIGGEGRVLSALRDITERKQAEQRAREKQRLEMVAKLAGGVAHEFNNNLAAMMLQLGLLKRKSGLDEETTATCQDLHEGMARAAALTRQLLMFSRQSVMQLKPVDLGGMAASLLRMVRRVVGEGILVGLEMAGGLPLVSADPGLLEQCVMNLCLNARDAMPRGGRLTLGARPAQFTAKQCKRHPDRRPGRFVCLAVADTGCGMEAATVGRLFEPFFTTKDVGQGTGMGLASVHGAVAQHQGWIEVESQPGQGSTFRIFLPELVESSADGDAVGAEEEAPLAKPAVLLVEDDAGLRRVLRYYLQHEGFEVLEAGGSDEALEWWDKRQADIGLLFADMIMPGDYDGRQLAEKLRASRPQLKVIITSGYHMELSQLGLPAGTDIVFLPKPYEVTDLARILRQCLEPGR